MKIFKSVLKSTFLFVFTILFFIQCDSSVIDPDGNNGNNGNGTSPKMGKANMKVTDAPIDNANISGAFITVTEIKVDGKTFSGFSGKQTIDLMAYQNGNVKALGLGELEVGTYSDISLVLDYAADVNGNAPGCYILTTDGVKHEVQSITSTQQELILNTAFEVKENETTDLVMDFDIRKAVTAEAQSSSTNMFEFVSQNELESSIRVVQETNTGMVKGGVQSNPLVSTDKVVVYAYKKGTFNESVEVSGQGESNIQFKNAVTSAVVDANGDYTLAFLEEGDYEVHFFAYEEKNDGSFSLEGKLKLNILGTLNLNNISVSAGASISLDLLITALLPI